MTNKNNRDLVTGLTTLCLMLALGMVCFYLMGYPPPRWLFISDVLLLLVVMLLYRAETPSSSTGDKHDL